MSAHPQHHQTGYNPPGPRHFPPHYTQYPQSAMQYPTSMAQPSAAPLTSSAGAITQQTSGMPYHGHVPMSSMPSNQSPVLGVSGPGGQAVRQRTPPVMSLGQMSEVPFPSQATMPEETPIIKMSEY